MGRELKRVPLDFNWSIGKIWYGYYSSFCHEDFHDGGCDNCKEFARVKGLQFTSYGCPDFEPLKGPPKGDGYQLWETTSEGSPTSPVFATLNELCEWCESNATTFAEYRTTAAEWKRMFEADFVHHQAGNVIFV